MTPAGQLDADKVTALFQEFSDRLAAAGVQARSDSGTAVRGHYFVEQSENPVQSGVVNQDGAPERCPAIGRDATIMQCSLVSP